MPTKPNAPPLLKAILHRGRIAGKVLGLCAVLAAGTAPGVAMLDIMWPHPPENPALAGMVAGGVTITGMVLVNTVVWVFTGRGIVKRMNQLLEQGLS